MYIYIYMYTLFDTLISNFQSARLNNKKYWILNKKFVSILCYLPAEEEEEEEEEEEKEEEKDVTLSMQRANRYWYNKAEYKLKMQSIKVTYPCCKFGFEYAFKQRDKYITKWRSVQNMHSFEANVVTILWEEKIQIVRFAVWLCMYVYMVI